MTKIVELHPEKRAAEELNAAATASVMAEFDRMIRLVEDSTSGLHGRTANSIMLVAAQLTVASITERSNMRVDSTLKDMGHI